MKHSADGVSPMNVILFGPPGSGKGTQAKHLVKDHGFTHVSTGDILRDEIKHSTALGRLASGYMREGRLVPDRYVGDMVKKNSMN
jgi:adenylate kinase